VLLDVEDGEDVEDGGCMEDVEIGEDMEDTGRMKGSPDVQEMQFVPGFTIELLFFLAKARRKLDCLLKHRDLNSHAEPCPLRIF
jgi:hypothetical protein